MERTILEYLGLGLAIFVFAVVPFFGLFIYTPFFLLLCMPPILLRLAARRLGITSRRVGLSTRTEARGEIEGVSVRLDHGRWSKWDVIHIHVGEEEGGKLPFHLEPSSGGKNWWSQDPLVTGDRVLDGALAIGNACPYALGILTPELRAMLMRLSGVNGFRMDAEGGHAIFSPAREMGRARAVRHVVETSRQMVAAWQQLTRTEPTRIGVIRSMLDDPDEGVKAKARALLAEDLDPLTGEESGVLLNALEEGDWPVAAVCAHLLGNQALPVLGRRLETLSLPWPDEAIGALAEVGTSGIIPILEKVAAHPRALRTLGGLDDPRCVPMILEAVKKTEAPEAWTAAAEALEVRADTRGEGFLMDMVKESGHPKTLRLAAVRALRTCGTLAAVEVLYPLAERIGPGGLKSEAARSMAKLQEKFGRGEGGELSLSQGSTEAGALSLSQASGESGALSLSQESSVGGGLDLSQESAEAGGLSGTQASTGARALSLSEGSREGGTLGLSEASKKSGR